MIRKLVALQILIALAAAICACVEVESILFTCPPLSLLGLVLGTVAVLSAHRMLLLYGLLGPTTTSIVALLIAGFQLGPQSAAIPVAILLAACAFGHIVVGWLLLKRQKKIVADLRVKSGRPQIRIRTLVIQVTVLAILLAVARILNWKQEWPIFGTYGLALMTIVGGLAIWYWNRNQKSSESAET